jgi:hypothetical protein
MYDPATLPRQKSCEACKMAKRRCDLTFPFCSRCVCRNLPCVYPGRQPSAYPNFAEEIPTFFHPLDDSSHRISTVPLVTINTNFCLPPNLALSTSTIDDAHWRYPHYVPQNQSLAAFEDAASMQNYDIVTPRTRSLRPLSAVVASRLQFAIDVLKDTPKMMVLENQTPWCHTQLYKNQMPKAMQGQRSYSHKMYTVHFFG